MQPSHCLLFLLLFVLFFPSKLHPPPTNFGNAAEHAEKDVKMKRRQQVTYNVT
jgi:hypothetical protein